jgi:hypothetical protein
MRRQGDEAAGAKQLHDVPLGSSTPTLCVFGREDVADQIVIKTGESFSDDVSAALDIPYQRDVSIGQSSEGNVPGRHPVATVILLKYVRNTVCLSARQDAFKVGDGDRKRRCHERTASQAATIRA